MKICIPVSEYRGLVSPIHEHFGSAPCFAMVDTETGLVDEVCNRDKDHVHGACNPVTALSGHHPDAVIVGGIGAGAVAGLRHAGIDVFITRDATVTSAVSHLAAGKLQEAFTATCESHEHDSGCAH